MTQWVRWLLIANVGVFLLQLAFPEVTDLFAFVPYMIFQRPWTLVTYMFLHSPNQFTHILFNMLALFFFGPRVEARLGSRRFITMYLIAGVMGGLLSVWLARMNPIIGASGAVYGVMLAFARFWPRDRIMIYGIIPVEARWLVVGTTAYALYSGFTGGGGGVANFAHLGGYVGAYLYLKWVEGRAPAKQWEKKVKGPAPSSIPLGDWKQLDITKVHEANRDEVNRILDKINASGVSSLTSSEKTFLQHFVPTPSLTLPS